MSSTSSLYGVRIDRMHRLPNTADGNPKWRLHLRDHDGREQIRTTLGDSAVGSSLHASFEGRVVDVLTNGRGDVVDVVDRTESPVALPLSDWRCTAEHTADECGFEPCSYCGCCAHGKALSAGCKTELAPMGMSCPVSDCGCEGMA